MALQVLVGGLELWAAAVNQMNIQAAAPAPATIRMDGRRVASGALAALSPLQLPQLPGKLGRPGEAGGGAACSPQTPAAPM